MPPLPTPSNAQGWGMGLEASPSQFLSAAPSTSAVGPSCRMQPLRKHPAALLAGCSAGTCPVLYPCTLNLYLCSSFRLVFSSTPLSVQHFPPFVKPVFPGRRHCGCRARPCPAVRPLELSVTGCVWHGAVPHDT